MNRRTFIKRTGITASGMIAFSSPFMAQDEIFARFTEIPNPNSQVRHGLYYLSRVKNPLLPNWFQLYDRHRFLSNGVEFDADDLITLPFKVNQSPIHLGYTQSSILLYADQVEKEVSRLNNSVSVELRNGYGLVLTSAQDTRVAHSKESISIVLEGSCKINGARAKQNAFILTENVGIEQEESSDESLVLHVFKTR